MLIFIYKPIFIETELYVKMLHNILVLLQVFILDKLLFLEFTR